MSFIREIDPLGNESSAAGAPSLADVMGAAQRSDLPARNGRSAEGMNRRLLVARGYACFNRGEYAAALDFFHRAADWREDPNLRCFEAHCLHSLGKTTKAKLLFSAVIKASPHHVPAHLGLAGLLRLEGANRDAEAVLRKALGTDRRHCEARRQLCDIYWTRALECRESQKWDEMHRLLGRVLTLDPDHGGARGELGLLWRRVSADLRAQGRWEDAEKFLRSSSIRNPKEVDLHRELAELWRMRASEAISKGRPEEAKALLKRMLSQGRDREDARRMFTHLCRRGAEVRWAMGRWKEAEDFVRSLLRLYSTEKGAPFRSGTSKSDSHKRMAEGSSARPKPVLRSTDGSSRSDKIRSRLSRGRWAEAARLVRRSMAAGLDTGSARRDLGDVLRLKASECLAWGKKERSKRLAARALCLDRAIISADINGFGALLRLGKYEQAFDLGESLLDAGPTLDDYKEFGAPWRWAPLEHFQSPHLTMLDKIIEKNLDSPWAYYYCGSLRGGYSGLAEFARIDRFPVSRYGWMHLRMGLAHLNLGLFRGAIKCLQVAIRHKPVNWIGYGYLAEANLCLGRRAAAFREFERAMAAAPAGDFAAVMAWRAEIRLWLGQYQKALRELEESSRKGCPASHCWRGAALLKLGRPREALKSLDQAIGAAIHDAEAYVWRAETKYRLGMYREALEDLSREPIGLWARVIRALVRAKLDDGEGMRQDFDKIPEFVISYLRRKAGFDVERELMAREMAALLETALRLARGVRRDGYEQAVWMV